MKKTILFLLLANYFVCFNAGSQVLVPDSTASTTNFGNEFWVGYPTHQFMNTATDNSQNMTLYIGCNSLPAGVSYATVTITIDSSGLSPALNWKRVYHIPAFSTVAIDNSATPAFSASPSTALTWGPIPKGNVNAAASNTSATFDARLYSDPFPAGTSSEGLFRKKGIHIESDYPIQAYAHIYGGVSSGAAMLIPVNNWGTKYTTINSRQADASLANNFFYVIATKDSTPIKIIPSGISRLGKPAGIPIYVTLQKGHIYQYVGQSDVSGAGVELTGSVVESLDPTKPIAVFAGSGRTVGEIDCGGGSGRDNDMQQCFSEESWGLQYLTAAFSNASSNTIITPSAFSQSIFKIVARDSGTFITINGGVPISVPVGSFYKFSNLSANFINANKPIAVAQFMSGACMTSLGDPEMIYLSPISRGVNKTAFYRTTKEAIQVNYLTLIVPDSGLSSLRIDGAASPWGGNSYVVNHPNALGYKIVVKGWPASKAQCIVTCNKKFTGITYGLGGAESYGYNVGANFFINTPNIYNSPKPKITGRVFCDINNNGIKDGNDFYKPFVKIGLSNSNYTFTDLNGVYNLFADSIGSYTVTTIAPNLFIAVPASTNYNFSKNDTVVTTDIALQIQASNTVDSLNFYISQSNNKARKGGFHKYYLVYSNARNSFLTPNITFNFDDTKLQYVSSSNGLNPTVSISSLNYAITTPMYPGEVRYLVINFKVNISTNIGDTIVSSATITANAITQSKTLKAIVVASFDPNAKDATPSMTVSEVVAGKDIDYTIHFQNTGTDYADKVTIIDSPSYLLKSDYLTVSNSSHPCTITVQNNRIKVVFNEIALPDSGSNNLLSNGFVSFKVRPLSTLTTGTIIPNKAYIYFDYNAPIITNTANTIIGGVVPVILTNYELRMMNEKQVANLWTTATEINTSHFNIQRSIDGNNFKTVEIVAAKGLGDYSFIDDIRNLELGIRNLYYRLEIVDKDGSKQYSGIRNVELGVKNNGISVFPNPAKDFVTVVCKDAKELMIVDYLGKVVYQSNVDSRPLTVETRQFAKGLYLVKAVFSNGNMRTEKLIVE